MENVIPCCHEVTYFSTANKLIVNLISLRGVLDVCMQSAVFDPKAETGGQTPAFALGFGDAVIAGMALAVLAFQPCALS